MVATGISVAVALELAMSWPIQVSLVVSKGICVSQLSLTATSSGAEQLMMKKIFF